MLSTLCANVRVLCLPLFIWQVSCYTYCVNRKKQLSKILQIPKTNVEVMPAAGLQFFTDLGWLDDRRSLPCMDWCPLHSILLSFHEIVHPKRDNREERWSRRLIPSLPDLFSIFNFSILPWNIFILSFVSSVLWLLFSKLILICLWWFLTDSIWKRI